MLIMLDRGRPGASRPYGLLMLATAFLGCRTAEPALDPEYRLLASQPLHGRATTMNVAVAIMPVSTEFAGEKPLDDCVQRALEQNPRIQAGRKRVEAAVMRIPQAASLKDPTIAAMGYPIFPNVQQTASGRMTADITVSQEVPWFGKRGAAATASAAESDMARAALVGAELETVEQVKRAYYELYYAERALDVTVENRRIALELSRIADARFRAALANEQDLLRSQLEVSMVDTEIVRMRQEISSAQAKLTRLLHVSPDTPIHSVRSLPDASLPTDLEALYAQAVALRPELHAQLAEVRRDRLNVELARLQYFPDVTFSVAWEGMTTDRAVAPTADGIDNINMGLMANVPIYRRRLAARLREAEATAVASAREYDNLRDETQETVKDLFAQAIAQDEMRRLFAGDIVPKADQTLQVSLAAYESGQVDFLTLANNWQQLLRYRIMLLRLETQMRQSLASLERIVGGMSPAPPPAENVPAPPVVRAPQNTATLTIR